METNFDIETNGNDVYVVCEVSHEGKSYVQARRLSDLNANDTSLASWCSFLYAVLVTSSFCELVGVTMRTSVITSRDSVLINQFTGKYKVKNNSIAWVKNKVLSLHNKFGFNLKHDPSSPRIKFEEECSSIKYKDIWKLKKS